MDLQPNFLGVILILSTYLKLPNEILGLILMHIPDPTTYLTASQVCRHWHTLIHDPINRRNFSKQWFLANCNKDYASSLIGHITRYARRHSKLTIFCITQYPHEIVWDEEAEIVLPGNESGRMKARRFVQWYPWRDIIFTRELWELLGRPRYRCLKQVVQRMADLSVGAELVAQQSPPYDIEDVVFPNILCELYQKREREKAEFIGPHEELKDERDYIYKQHEYLVGVTHLQSHPCVCGKEVPGEEEESDWEV
ncbi:hypothetical protein BJ508DRAFT_306360 [Ascobolus immersus RN42]|uniref:F-box domain-containing protein n=1 Tax=Ascobolus immersus RN42 TaxID=1160509 RepID=A0A3N4I6P2_ASCIM|nr:hypothetical protein BJ508DRAFT_306360 [Ascobolus immersus RN42]